jgi:outer membrane protein
VNARSRRRPSLVLASGLALFLAASPAAAETLGEAIALAYETNPTVQGQRASLRALDETYEQAEAGYRPTASLQATVTTDRYNQNARGLNRPIPGVTIPPVIGSTQTSGAALSVTQPIYTGGRVAAQISAARASILAGREQLRATEETVLRDVITAYVDVRRDQQDVTILEGDVALLLGELEESRARFGVGAITRTDVAETEARVAASQAQLETARARLGDSRANYVALVGRNPGALAPEPSLSRSLPLNLDDAFERAERNSPQILQATFTERSSAARLAEAKSQTRPTLAVQGTVGFSGGQVGFASPFQNYSRDITASAVASFPIFTGGMTSSQIRQAAETNNADRIGIEVARRQSLLTVSQAWNALMGARASLAADEAQVKAANIAFEGSRQEARVGLRSVLDVLIAEQNLSAAQLALTAARHDEYVSAAALLGASGGLRAQDFAPDAPVYDPRTNLRRVQGKWPWTPWSPVIGAVDALGAPAAPPPPPGASHRP